MNIYKVRKETGKSEKREKFREWNGFSVCLWAVPWLLSVTARRGTTGCWILFEEPLPPEVFVCIGGQGRELDYENGPVETQRGKDEERSRMDFFVAARVA